MLNQLDDSVDRPTNATNATNVFPLALTPFEYYYWCDDRPEYPTCYPVEMTFSGPLDRKHFLAAWSAATARHPMLGARIDTSGKRPMWVAGDGDPPPVDWADGPTPVLPAAGRQIDLRTECGVKAWVRIGPSTTRLRLQFHHACCDGQAAVQFVEELLVRYHCEVVGDAADAELPTLDPDLLKTRGMPPQVSVNPPLRLKLYYTWLIARDWAKLLIRNPLPLAAPAGPDVLPDTETTDTDFVTRTLDIDVVRRLRRIASERGVTVNDLLLRDAFGVISRWNERCGDARDGWLRINMPVSFRSRADRRLPAANRLSFAFLTRRSRDCRNDQRLLDSIVRETRDIKRNHAHLTFLGGLDFAQSVPGMLPWFLNRQRCFATMVVSNVGRVFARTRLPRCQGKLVCGNVQLDDFNGVPPIRPFTRASLVILDYARHTNVSLQCDPRHFSAAQATELLDNYIACLQQTAGAGR
jgi:hypothetical protein